MNRSAIVLLGYVVLSLTAKAHADVRVFVTRMTVNDCSEIGS